MKANTQIIGKLSYLDVMRELFACFFVIWIINPMSYGFYNWIYCIPVMCAWLLLALCNIKLFLSILQNRAFLFSTLYTACHALYFLLGHADFVSHSIIPPFIFFMSLYYSKLADKRIMKLLTFISGGYYLIISLVTFIQLNSNPMLARQLANGDTELVEDFATPFTADFAFIYSCVLLAIVLFGLVILNTTKGNRKVVIFLSIVFLVIIIKSQYAMAVLFSIGFFIMELFFVAKNKVFKTLGILLIILLPFIDISWILYSFADLLSAGILQNRIFEIATIFKQGAFVVGGGLDTRLQLYSLSWDTFLDNFFFGIGHDGIKTVTLSGHSEILDRFAIYGLIGGVVFISVCVIMYRELRKFLNTETRRIYSITFVAYIVMAITNYASRDQFFLMLFMIIPFWLQQYSPDRKL